jgi:hypothetical protein
MPSSRTDSSTLSILGLNDSKDKKLNYRIVILGNAKVGKNYFFMIYKSFAFGLKLI